MKNEKHYYALGVLSYLDPLWFVTPVETFRCYSFDEVEALKKSVKACYSRSHRCIEIPIEKISDTTRQSSLAFYKKLDSNGNVMDFGESFLREMYQQEKGRVPQYVLSIVYFSKKHFIECLKDAHENK